MTLTSEELRRIVIEQINAVRMEFGDVAEPDEETGRDRAEWYLKGALYDNDALAHLPQAIALLHQLWPET